MAPPAIQAGFLALDNTDKPRSFTQIAALFKSLSKRTPKRGSGNWDARKKALGGFSGGMKQRFGIAQASSACRFDIISDIPTPLKYLLIRQRLLDATRRHRAKDPTPLCHQSRLELKTSLLSILKKLVPNYGHLKDYFLHLRFLSDPKTDRNVPE